jgi:AN1-like Zinc finger
VIPECPICSQAILVKATDDPNAMMERHIASGCKKGVLAVPEKKQGCMLSSCKDTKNYAIVKCGKCSKSFCVKHRFPTDHGCTGYVSNNRITTGDSSTSDSKNSSKNKSGNALLARLAAQREDRKNKDKRGYGAKGMAALKKHRNQNRAIVC